MNKKSSGVKFFLSQFFLILLAALIFFLANPNPVIKNGLGFLGFLTYLPVIFCVCKSSFKNVWLFGGIYGALAYGLYGYWLHSFHPLGLAIVCIFYFLILALVFLCLKLIEKLFQKNAWLVQWLFLASYEYLKTLGFAGFSYGVTAYTQWKNLYFIQIVDLIGVFGLNLVVIFPSFWIFSIIIKSQKRFFLLNAVEEPKVENHKTENHSNISAFVKKEKALKLTDRRATVITAFVWLGLVLSFYIYGFVDIGKKENHKENHKSLKVAAIQNNEDPWKNGINEYSKNIQSLKELTDEALEFYPDIDFVIWPETAVVPSIIHHYYDFTDQNRFKLVYSLLNYIENKDAIFVIGNAHEEISRGQNIARYNSAFVFQPGKNVIPPEPDQYSKIHLVPFTEHFPYAKYFPKLYKLLLNGDTHMWENGKIHKVFDYKGLKFSTPICFEDTFGNDCRIFVKKGARAFFNLSNDAWSKSLACQNQHLAMAVFRSVENRIPSVRSTASGQTCIINQNGFIEAETPEFCRSFVVGNIPILGDDFKESFYTKYGDLFGLSECLITGLILIIQIFSVIIRHILKTDDSKK